jgi:hypothetical protein
LSSPADDPPEVVLSFTRNDHAFLAGLLAEPGNPPDFGRSHGQRIGSIAYIGRGHFSDNQNLVAINRDGWSLLEPLLGQAADKPA